MHRLDSYEINGYLRRLGINAIEPPSKEFLFGLHRAHVEKIPWQTVDIFAGAPYPIDTVSSVKMMLKGKSGYCFHHNGAFACLLKSLGFTVSLHRAGVQSRGNEPCIDSNHLGLIIYFEDSSQETEKWIVDVGLGDMIFEPVPLRKGFYNQGAFTYEVEESKACNRGWRLVHDPKGTFAGVDYDPIPINDISYFQPNHLKLSQSPDSPWVNLLVAKNRHQAGSNSLIGCVFSYFNDNRFHSREVDNKAEWLDILSDVFDIHLKEYSPLKRDQLWSKTLAKHMAWKKEKQSN